MAAWKWLAGSKGSNAGWICHGSLKGAHAIRRICPYCSPHTQRDRSQMMSFLEGTLYVKLQYKDILMHDGSLGSVCSLNKGRWEREREKVAERKRQREKERGGKKDKERKKGKKIE